MVGILKKRANFVKCVLHKMFCTTIFHLSLIKISLVDTCCGNKIFFIIKSYKPHLSICVCYNQGTSRVQLGIINYYWQKEIPLVRVLIPRSNHCGLHLKVVKYLEWSPLNYLFQNETKSKVDNCTLWFHKLPWSEANEQVI